MNLVALTAGMALRLARQDLRKLEKAQQAIIKRTEEMVQASYHWLFVGAAFMLLGGTITLLFYATLIGLYLYQLFHMYHINKHMILKLLPAPTWLNTHAQN